MLKSKKVTLTSGAGIQTLAQLLSITSVVTRVVLVVVSGTVFVGDENMTEGNEDCLTFSSASGLVHLDFDAKDDALNNLNFLVTSGFGTSVFRLLVS